MSDVSDVMRDKIAESDAFQERLSLLMLRAGAPAGDDPHPTLDPRWEWVEVQRRLCDADPTYAKGRCRHTEVVPVISCGETVAHLCLTCDAQLPAELVSP